MTKISPQTLTRNLLSFSILTTKYEKKLDLHFLYRLFVSRCNISCTCLSTCKSSAIDWVIFGRLQHRFELMAVFRKCIQRQHKQVHGLTVLKDFTGGVVFFKTPIQGSFIANFRYKVGGGSHQGDGFTMFFYKQKYSSLDTGGSQGFNSKENSIRHIVPGYGIEFDAWQNWVSDFQQIPGTNQNPQGDPSANHIGLIEGFSGNHLAYVDDSRVADNNWHKVSISVQGSSVSVYVDQGLVLQWNGALNRTFDGLGFSAGTGGPGSNMHVIDDFLISASAIHTPSLTTSCISPQSQLSAQVKVHRAGFADVLWCCTSLRHSPSNRHIRTPRTFLPFSKQARCRNVRSKRMANCDWLSKYVGAVVMLGVEGISSCGSSRQSRRVLRTVV